MNFLIGLQFTLNRTWIRKTALPNIQKFILITFPYSLSFHNFPEYLFQKNMNNNSLDCYDLRDLKVQMINWSHFLYRIHGNDDWLSGLHHHHRFTDSTFSSNSYFHQQTFYFSSWKIEKADRRQETYTLEGENLYSFYYLNLYNFILFFEFLQEKK